MITGASAVSDVSYILGIVMIREYLGNNAYRYTLTSGSEIILTDEEFNELIENSPLVEDLLDQIEDLESDVKCLQKDVDDNIEEIDS